jgi:hypothetical protein
MSTESDYNIDFDLEDEVDEVEDWMRSGGWTSYLRGLVQQAVEEAEAVDRLVQVQQAAAEGADGWDVVVQKWGCAAAAAEGADGGWDVIVQKWDYVSQLYAVSWMVDAYNPGRIKTALEWCEMGDAMAALRKEYACMAASLERSENVGALLRELVPATFGHTALELRRTDARHALDNPWCAMLFGEPSPERVSRQARRRRPKRV